MTTRNGSGYRLVDSEILNVCILVLSCFASVFAYFEWMRLRLWDNLTIYKTIVDDKLKLVYWILCKVHLYKAWPNTNQENQKYETQSISHPKIT